MKDSHLLLIKQERVVRRRQFLQGLVAASAFAAAIRPASVFADVEPAPSEIRVGYQKNGVLVVARQQAALENHFASKGVRISWFEFPSGPPMLEAMNAGGVDLGAVGDSPPIFAQAAGANIVYVAGQPITNGQGILVPAASTIRSVQDLKGKRVGFTKGSSAHSVLVQALEKAGLSYNDITAVYLSPPDALAAFANGGIDAWGIWDPFFAIGEIKQKGRILIQASEVAKTNSFFIANRNFANAYSPALREVLSVLADTARWAESHRDETAKLLSEVTGVPLDIQTVAAARASYAIGPITDDILRTQQDVADRYHELGLIPKSIVVSDIVWRPAQI
jgi:sulfonate transport system substrate-binding protein